MKRILPFSLALILFVLSIYISAFQTKTVEPIQEVRNSYNSGLEKTLKSIDQIHDLSLQLSDSEKSIEEIRKAFIEARLNFKSIEYLAEHLDHDYIKDYINGAPLPSLKKKMPMPIRLDPSGFQILDEMIFSENPVDNIKEIQELSASLSTDFKRFEDYQKNLLFYDRVVFEASRAELIRIITLGLTGFDTPLSGNAIPEAKSSLTSMKNAFEVYKDFLNNSENGIGNAILGDFEVAINYLNKNVDFDTFDRLYFYREILRPLDQKIQKAHLASGIETSNEVNRHIPSVNYFASDFFDEDYLNPYYFTRLTEQEDSPELIELGKTLFYDPILSANNERSCASCHNPQKAFTDGKRKSIAKDFNGNVDRNAPTLINSVFSERYFHDMRALNLETLLEHVVTNRKEFSLGLIQLENKLKQSSEYQTLFEKAFEGTNYSGIGSQAITAAITSYIKSLNSFDSEFDLYVRNEKTQIDESIHNGFNLFMGKAACGTCHFAPVFNGTIPPNYRESESEILGTPEENDPNNMRLDPDEGRYRGIAKEKIDFYQYSFKTPTVRNIALTAPYMHNGVYNTLEEVMDFYNKGGGEGLGYEVPNQTLPFDQLNLTDKEQSDIIAFMNALTDTVGLTSVPTRLPVFENNPEWNKRKVGGVY